MITRPSNWDNVQAFTDRPKLPVGAYVCRIKRAVVKDGSTGAQLCVLFDIEDGEYAGFYKADFNANTAENKKWRGVLRLFLPKNDGSEKDEWTKSTLKGFVTSVEESNRGYYWDWDENSLAGLELGIIFRNEEWDYNGRTGWAVRPFRACPVDTVQDGDYKLPPDKPLKGPPSSATPGASSGAFTDYNANEDDLPF